MRIYNLSYFEFQGSQFLVSGQKLSNLGLNSSFKIQNSNPLFCFGLESQTSIEVMKKDQRKEKNKTERLLSHFNRS